MQANRSQPSATMNVTMLDSYILMSEVDPTLGKGEEKFVFPFQNDNEHGLTGVQSFSEPKLEQLQFKKKDPLTNDIPLRSLPILLDPSASNNATTLKGPNNFIYM